MKLNHKKIIEKYPWLKDMKKEFDVISDRYYVDINKLDKKYIKIAKKHKLKGVEIWFSQDDGPIGIDFNLGGGLIHFDELEDKE